MPPSTPTQTRYAVNIDGVSEVQQASARGVKCEVARPHPCSRRGVPAQLWIRLPAHALKLAMVGGEEDDPHAMPGDGGPRAGAGAGAGAGVGAGGGGEDEFDDDDGEDYFVDDVP